MAIAEGLTVKATISHRCHGCVSQNSSKFYTKFSISQVSSVRSQEPKPISQPLQTATNGDGIFTPLMTALKH